MIFTCNFANWKKIPLPVAPISIALHPPEGWSGKTYPPFFPTKELLYLYKNNLIDDVKYSQMYKDQILRPLDPATVVNEIYDMRSISTTAIALLCYEHSNKFCHRHIVRAWLTDHGFVAREFSVTPQLKTSLGLRRV